MTLYLIFGAQGSGKSTFAPYIAQKLGVPYITTGEIFRAEMEKKTPLGAQVEERMNKGILIDDETTWLVLKPFLEQATGGVLLDGFPRNINQSELLETEGYEVSKIFYMTVSEGIAQERLLARGRTDDTPEGIKNRLGLYNERTLPVIDFYKRSGVEVIELDNSSTQDKVRDLIDDYFKN